MAMGALITHWLLLFGYGLAFNDQGGSDYCILTMPSLRDPEVVSWVFTVVGLIVLCTLGSIDRLRLKLSWRFAFYPLPLFVISQLFSMTLLEWGTRY